MENDVQAGAQNFPLKTRRGLGHVTPTIFGSTVGYPSDSLAFCYRLAAPFTWFFSTNPDWISYGVVHLHLCLCFWFLDLWV